MLFFIKIPIILYICRHKHLINHDKIFINKKKSLVLKSIAIIIASCFIQQTINAQSSLKYKKATLSYVDLSDSAKITSKPIKTRKIKFRNVDKYKFSHVGVAYLENEQWYVLEAITKGVCKTKIEEFLKPTTYKGKPIFALINMTFKDGKTGQIGAYWVNLFKQLHRDVPEGALGSNPGQLSKSKNIDIIGIMTLVNKN